MTVTIAVAAVIGTWGILGGALAALALNRRGYDQRLATLLEEARDERHAFLELLANQSRAARDERATAAEERRALADRIQHPDRVQVLPNPDYVPPEPPLDALEMAMVGQIVPEFVHVGTPESE
jgi:hypothetical protein